MFSGSRLFSSFLQCLGGLRLHQLQTSAGRWVKESLPLYYNSGITMSDGVLTNKHEHKHKLSVGEDEERWRWWWWWGGREGRHQRYCPEGSGSPLGVISLPGGDPLPSEYDPGCPPLPTTTTRSKVDDRWWWWWWRSPEVIPRGEWISSGRRIIPREECVVPQGEKVIGIPGESGCSVGGRNHPRGGYHRGE